MKNKATGVVPFYIAEHLFNDHSNNHDKQAFTLPDFHEQPDQSFFGVYSFSRFPCKDSFSPGGRPFYKISFVTKGSGMLYYGDQQIPIKPGSLIFINPNEYKRWVVDAEQDGCYCIFTEQFYAQSSNELHELAHYPLFKGGINPLVQLNRQQLKIVSGLFDKIIKENQGCYPLKKEALRLYIKLLMVEARRIANHTAPLNEVNAAHMLVQRFNHLLDLQFPVVRVTDQLKLKNVSEFADELAVHSNHLNACVKKVTGHTASRHISARILREAKLLLMHTDWHISEIAWCLGFEEPASFAHFFKKNAGVTANHFRQQAD